MKISDRAVGVTGIVFSAYFISTIWNTQFETKAFPMVSLVMLMVLSAILALRRDRKQYALENVKQVLMGVGLLLLYILGLKFIGFIAASILYLFAFVFLNRFEGRKIVAVVYCIVLPVFLYTVFQLLFHIRLPQGIL